MCAARDRHGRSREGGGGPGPRVNLDAARVDALSQDLAEALGTELEVDTLGGLEVRRRLPIRGPDPAVRRDARRARGRRPRDGDARDEAGGSRRDARPPVVEPSATEPTATEPPAARVEPSATEPSATEPRPTRPATKRPPARALGTNAPKAAQAAAIGGKPSEIRTSANAGITAQAVATLYSAALAKINLLPSDASQDLMTRWRRYNVQSLMLAPQAERDQAAAQLSKLRDEAVERLSKRRKAP